MVVLPNFHVGNFKAIFSGDLMDNPFEGDLDPTGKDFVSVFGSPNNVVIKVVDRCSAICKSVCIFHTNDYTIIHVSHIRPSGVKKGAIHHVLKRTCFLAPFQKKLTKIRNREVKKDSGTKRSKN